MTAGAGVELHQALLPRDCRAWLPGAFVAVLAGFLPLQDQGVRAVEVPVPGTLATDQGSEINALGTWGHGRPRGRFW